MELSFDAGSWWSYVLVVIAAATPVIEVLVVIPAGIIAGMPAVPTALLALAGNLATVVLAVLAGERVLEWWRARRAGRGAGTPGESRKAERARRLARRWGVPGLGLLAPISTGTHLAALAALATGASRGRVLVWMTVGLSLWAAVVAVAAATGTRAFF